MATLTEDPVATPITPAQQSFDPATTVELPETTSVGSILNSALSLADAAVTEGTQIIESIIDAVAVLPSDPYAGIYHAFEVQPLSTYTPSASQVNVPHYGELTPGTSSVTVTLPSTIGTGVDSFYGDSPVEFSAPSMAGYGFPMDAPSDPGDIVDVAVPSAPVISFPAVPSMDSIVIPDIPTLDIPIWTDDLAASPLSPDVSFSFSDTAYMSDLLTSYRDLIQSWVDGASTGIAADVERAIWDRGRDREAASFIGAMNQIARDFAARGFPIPPGAALSLTHQAQQKAREAASTISRDVMIKQAELEQQNRQFAISEARQIEIAEMADTAQFAQRQFEAAKYVVEAAIAVYSAQVQQYNADVQAFVARATVYRERIQGELARLEVYKSQLEGQRLVATLNQQAIEIYTARLDAVKTTIGVYEQQVNAARITAEIQKVKIDAFKARVDAYASKVSAKAGEYEAYSKVAQAEVARQELRRIGIEQYKVASDVQLRGHMNGIEQQKVGVSGQAVQVEAQKVNMEAQARAAEVQVRSRMADIEASSVEQRAEAARLQRDASAEQAQAEIQKAQIQAGAEGLRTQAMIATARMQQQIDQSRITSAGVIAAGQIQAQIQAAQLAMYNISTSESKSEQTSKTQSSGHHTSQSVSASQSWNHNYSE